MLILGCMYDINTLSSSRTHTYTNLLLLWESWWGFLFSLMDACKFMAPNLYHATKEGILRYLVFFYIRFLYICIFFVIDLYISVDTFLYNEYYINAF